MSLFSECEYAIATDRDNRAILECISKSSMVGDIHMAWHRQPHYALGELVGNNFYQTMILRHRQTGQVFVTGSRAGRTAYVDHQPREVGYLSNLRVDPTVRGLALARGFQFLRQQHQDGRVPFYYNAIFDDNNAAKAVLLSGRAGLPNYREFARLTTYLIPLRRQLRMQRRRYAIRRVKRRELDRVIDFVNHHNQAYQLAPVFEKQDFTSDKHQPPQFCEKYPLFDPDNNVYVAYDGEQIAGTCGIWDQRFKQLVVTGYSLRMEKARHIYNLYAYLRGQPLLPEPGSEVRILYTLMLSGFDNPEAFLDLLTSVQMENAGRGYDYLAVTVQSGTRQADICRKLAFRTTSSTVYLVYWNEDASMLPHNGGQFHIDSSLL